MNGFAKAALAIMYLASGVSAAGGQTSSGTAASPSESVAAAQDLTADQVVDRYVAACGGAEAWKKVETMTWEGHVETGPGGISKAPFVMNFRRPDETRFEIMVEGRRSLRVFDGKVGWKRRLGSDGMPVTKDYSPDEVSFARDAGGLDGPLLDYKSKGITVTLEGIDSVEGRKAYRLGLQLPSGRNRTDWIDAQTFVELRYDREVRDVRGLSRTVTVYTRDYRSVEGLALPSVIETGNSTAEDANKMVIEKVYINPRLPDNLFERPAAPRGKHNGVLIDTTRPPPSGFAPGER
jgi:hypothetical protein